MLIYRRVNTMLTKETVIDKIEILETNHIQVRRSTYILENGVRIVGPEYHRVAYEPGAGVLSEDAKVRAIAAVVWTPEIIAAHKARVEANRL